MFSETVFLMVFGLGAACILLGFFLVARNIGAADGESAVKVIGIEVRASKVGPGVLFALFGLVLVVTALVKQGPSGSPATAPTPGPSAVASASGRRTMPPAAVPPQAVAAPAGDLVAELARRNVHGSAGDAVLREWTEGGYYRRLALGTLAELGSRRLSGGGVDLLKVNYFYLREMGVDDEAKLPGDHVIEPVALQRALVLAHRDMNGGAPTKLADIAQ
jgi:hypothetical protein